MSTLTSSRFPELSEKIKKLKEKRKAVILAHNYQKGEVQDVADFVGDSLELSQKAAKTDAEVIVFCGVHFMAETAKILSPEKTVLLPDLNAGCPMANMITTPALREKRERDPSLKVVCYVNSTAAVKAESDLCCTSANAIRVINSLDEDSQILFVPDQYLGHYVSRKTQRKVKLWEGFCPTHLKILPENILELKKRHPEAKVIVHPECTPPVIDLADEVLSTGGMVRYARNCEAREIIVGTEVGILHRLKKENPQKVFIPANPKALCPNMKLINLEKVLWSLEDMIWEIKIPEEIRLKAKNSLDRMLEI